jgi:hypothetical protein
MSVKLVPTPTFFKHLFGISNTFFGISNTILQNGISNTSALRLPDKAAGQGCRARLPGKAAGQGCRARLPGNGALC